MNALYVTVSIPLLLVLAGFNHAHGLTTFGKSNTPQGPQTVANGKHCTSQADCIIIKGTTCIDKFCLCGDNTNPKDARCTAEFKGPKHICETDDECVDRAECLEPKEKMKPNTVGAATPVKICQCQEGYVDTPAGTCSGGTSFTLLPGLLLLSVTLAKVY